MAKAANDGSIQSPRQALEDAIDSIGKDGAFKNGKKILILALDDTDDNFNVNFIQAGMRMSECLSVCEAAKAIFLDQMNYIN